MKKILGIFLLVTMIVNSITVSFAVTPEEIEVEGYNTISLHYRDESSNESEPWAKTATFITVSENEDNEKYISNIAEDDIVALKSGDKFFVENTGKEPIANDIFIFYEVYHPYKDGDLSEVTNISDFDIPEGNENKFVLTDSHIWQLTNKEQEYFVGSEITPAGDNLIWGLLDDYAVPSDWGRMVNFKYISAGEKVEFTLPENDTDAIYHLYCAKYYMEYDYMFWSEGYFVYDNKFVTDHPSKPVEMVKPFDDVKTSDYYAEAVRWAYDNKITTGTDTNKFSPAETCTRGQVVTFLYRAAGSPNVDDIIKEHKKFNDVAESSYYYNAVMWAVKNGITNGTGDNNFSPDNKCTKAQILTFLFRSAKSPKVEQTNWSSKIDKGYWTDAINWADSKNLLDSTKNSFDVNDPCPRSDIVYYMYNANK